MKRFNRIFFGTLAAVVITFILGGVLVGKAGPRGDIYEYLTSFREVLHLVNSSYVDEVELDRVMEGAFKGMMESLDASSVYLDPAQYARHQQGLSVRPDLLGITVSKRYTYAVIVAVAPGSPAAEAGLHAGDLIRSIDGRMVREMNRLEVEEALLGAAESVVTLAVIYQQTAERDEVTMTRREVRPLGPELVRLPGGVAYLRIHDLAAGAGDRAGRLLAEAAALPEGEPMSLVLDLRNNPGRLLAEAVAVTDLFLSSGTIVTVGGQEGEGERREASAGTTRFAGPVVVLMDRGTANGAEVVVAALQQNQRATTVGEPSFGSGSIQELIPLSNGGALLLAVARHRTPDGKAIVEEGIIPDEEIEPDAEAPILHPTSSLDAESLADDHYVRRALELLQAAGEEEASRVDEAAAA